MKIKLVEAKRALVKRGAGLAIVLAAALVVSGCGGNIKDLLKDSPSKEEQPSE